MAVIWSFLVAFQSTRMSGNLRVALPGWLNAALSSQGLKIVLVETEGRAASTAARMAAIVGSATNDGPPFAAKVARLAVHAGLPLFRGLEATQVVQAFPACKEVVPYVNNPLAASWVKISRVNERD